MKISIWQQFSSNHSSSIRVIGKFKSIEDAEEAKTILNQLMYDIAHWYEDNDWTGELSKPEKEIAEKYQIEWHEPIDYLDGVSRISARKSVESFKNLLEFGGYTGTGLRKDQLESLVEKLGADEVAGWEIGHNDDTDSNTIFSMTVKATAPDENAIKTIIADWITRFKDIKPEHITQGDLTVQLNYPYFDLEYFRYFITSLEQNKFTDISYHLNKKKFDF